MNDRTFVVNPVGNNFNHRWSEDNMCVGSSSFNWCHQHCSVKHRSSIRDSLNNYCITTLQAGFRQQFSSHWRRGRWWWLGRATCTGGSLWSPRSLRWVVCRNYPMPSW